MLKTNGIRILSTKEKIIMEDVLFINACARPESRTLDLAQSLLEKINDYANEPTKEE